MPTLAVLPALPEVDAVMLDLDGTLVDTLGDFTAALHGMFEELGLSPGPQALLPSVVESMVGKGSEHLIRSALQHMLSASGCQALALQAQVEYLFPQALTVYQDYYARINGRHARVYPGVQSGLDRLAQQGLPLACLTNKPVRFARQLLDGKGLAVSFAQVFGGDSFERKKPDPLPLRKTCEALGTLPERTLMVGDSINDAQAARAAGCPVVLVSYGYNHGLPIRSVPADAYIDSLAELA